jgi:aminopeptidase N
VPGQNLTRDEARERADTLSVADYVVELDLTKGPERFGSTTTISFDASSPETFLELLGAVVSSVRLNGVELDPATVYDGSARISLTGLQAHNEVTITANCSYMHTGEGLHRFVDPVDDAVYLYTQFEVNDARRMYACFDQPDLKGRFTFTVTAPLDWQVISNSPTPEPEVIDGGRGVWRFATTPVLPTYVTALCAGPYHVVRGDRNGMPMGVFCRASLADHLDAEEILDVTKRGFDHFETLFGRAYPFEKYDQLFVPEFNAGAMENAGAVTFLEDYVFRSKVTDAAYERRAETILHELAHMWFGDLVTMRWWDDLWLNESFATFASVDCQASATRWTDAWTTFANLEKTWAYRQDQMPSTHPIAADIRDIEDVEVNFDGITYAKGASVLKQLVAWVGRDKFYEGMRRYFERHAWGNTSLSDLLAVLEEVSGRDLSGWAKEWLETAGVNTLRADFTLAEDGTYSSFAVVQQAPATQPTLRSHRLAVGQYERTEAGLVRTGRIELDVSGERTEVPQLIGARQPDLLMLNDDDLTYAKLRLDQRSLRTVVAGIGEFEDSLPRALAWAAAWDMTRDAEMPAREFAQLTLHGVNSETDLSVVQVVLRQAATALYLYATEDEREAELENLASGLQALLHDAAADSDHQLAYMRAFASIARTSAQLDLVEGILDGSRQLDGLTVDADLRWALLQRLVATGRVDESAIDAELARDATAAGQRHAATTRALMPTVAAKQAAWDAILDDTLPNALLSATVGGFAHPDQLELLDAFVEPYFSVIDDVWANATNETAQTIVVGLYPLLLVSPTIVERTTAYLADQQPVPALRRLIIEGRDSVERALRCREFAATGS